METSVVNIKNKKGYDVYIGRPSLFENPYTFKESASARFMVENRTEAIAKYREYFHERLERDQEFKREVLKLKGKRLGCWCYPLRCHGDVIVEYLNNSPIL